MATVKRYDFGTLGKVERTPQGGVRIPAALARTGVYVYQLPDGTERRELRLPEEVFAHASLESLKHAPVTNLHPAEMVTPANWQTLSVGHVAEDVGSDGDHITASLVIQASDAIAKIDSGALKEISPGYECRLEISSGVYEGEPYDAIQRGIVYNHVAIGPANWARGGKTCALRLDSQDAVQVTERGSMKTIRIDGVDYVVGSPEHIAKLDGDNAKLRGERDAVQGRADMAEAKLAKLEDKIKQLEDPKRLDGIVKERADLCLKARRVLGQRFDASGKSDQEIKLAIIDKLDPSFKADGKSADYLDGAFRALTRNDKRDEGEEGTDEEETDPEKTDEGDDPNEPKKDGGVRDVVKPRKNDTAEPRVDSAASHARMRKDSANRYLQPLAMSKGK